MAIRIYKGGEKPPSYRRIGLYGPPKIGKTRLAAAYDWPGRAVYVGWDLKTLDLDHSSILPEHRERLVYAGPEGEPEMKAGKPTGKTLFDPLESGTELACKDWKKEDPEITTIIWDTMSETSADLLKAMANQMRYGSSITFGKSDTDSWLVHPQPGDYGAAQGYTQQLLDHLFDQPLHLICLFHERGPDMDDDNKIGGPAVAGKAATGPVAGRFDNLFRISPKRVRIGTSTPPSYETRRVVYTEPEGYWMAGIRSGQVKNTLGDKGVYTLTDNPTQFWVDLEKSTKGSN